VRLAADGEAGVPATVVARMFAGAVVRLEAEPRAAPGKVVVVDAPAGPGVPEVGAAVGLVLPRERLRLLPAEAETIA
jgi:hypothetical protein